MTTSAMVRADFIEHIKDWMGQCLEKELPVTLSPDSFVNMVEAREIIDRNFHHIARNYNAPEPVQKTV
jgi:hypothetical protein